MNSLKSMALLFLAWRLDDHSLSLGTKTWSTHLDFFLHNFFVLGIHVVRENSHKPTQSAADLEKWVDFCHMPSTQTFMLNALIISLLEFTRLNFGNEILGLDTCLFIVLQARTSHLKLFLSECQHYHRIHSNLITSIREPSEAS